MLLLLCLIVRSILYKALFFSLLLLFSLFIGASYLLELKKHKTVTYEAKTVISKTNGMFLTEVFINGQSFPATVDTGASFVSIDRETAAKLGIDYQNAFSIKSTTANGQIDALIVNFSSVRVGGIQFQNVQGAIVEKPMDSVLIGMSFLNQTTMTFKNGKLELSNLQ